MQRQEGNILRLKMYCMAICRVYVGTKQSSRKDDIEYERSFDTYQSLWER